MEISRPLSRFNADIGTEACIVVLQEAVKGDHIYNYGMNICDSIVVARDSYKGILEVVTGENDGDHVVYRLQVIEVKAGDMVTKLVYSCPGDSHAWVQRATSKIGTKIPIEDVTHASAFIMSCKRGGDIHWKDTYISELKGGDHVKVGSQHGIVEMTKLRRQEVHYITMDCSSERSVQRKTFRNAVKFQRATYNTCCTNDEALTYAKYLLKQPAVKKFKTDVEFSKHCKSGVIAEAIPLSDAALSSYAPPTRPYNKEVISKWQKTPLQSVRRGDHAMSDEYKIPHSIVEKRTGRVLHLIGCIQEKGQLVIDRFSIEVPSSDATVDVAVYTSSVDSGSAVQKAISLLRSSRAKSFMDNEIDFVMLCKRGEEIEWKTTFINSLKRGDHIYWYNGLTAWQHHGIVHHVNAAHSTVMCYKYTYSGIQSVKIQNQHEFKRAIYNSSYDANTVLKLAESRLGETNHHPFGNDDVDLARWCNTGQLRSRIARKTLVLSADMLKRGDQVSWTRIVTYDHHALVKRVIGPNEIEVYEFTTRSGDKTRGKTYKKMTILPIFSGGDPVYKVTYIPAEDPEKLLEEAAKQEGDLGGYNLLLNNCENFAGNVDGLASQVKAFFLWIKSVFVKWCPNSCVRVFESVAGKVVAYAVSAGTTVTADAVVKYGLDLLMTGLNATAIVIPVAFEFFMMIWDLNHDWTDHKRTRILIGGAGIIMTALVLWMLAAPVLSIRLSIGQALKALCVGFGGSAVTTVIMRFIRRFNDQRECRDAFKGLYEDKAFLLEKFAHEFVQQLQDNTQHISKTITGLAAELS